MSEQKKWAKRYASLGWHVFPCSIAKAPLIEGGFKNASTDLNKINEWWTKWPDASIGVATGVKSGIVALDVDMGKPGAEANLRTIIETRGAFSESVVSRTGGGGFHFIFKHPGGTVRIRNAQSFLGMTGIDIRGDGGYIIVPPSPHPSGNPYSWGPEQSPFDQTPGDCPAYIYEERETQRIQVAFNWTGQIQEGERNATLTAIAGVLRSLGLDAEAIFQVLSIQNNSRCNPPLPDTDVRTIATHITQYPPRVNTNQVQVPDRAGLAEMLRFEQSDTGYGQMIAFHHLGKIKYDHTAGQWYLWGHHHWVVDETESIMLRANDTAMLYQQAVSLIQDEDAAKRARKHATSMQQLPRIMAGLVLARVQESVATTRNQWNANPDIIAARNGVINLRTGTLRDGLPEDLMSASASVDYDPDAECPNWEHFLQEVFAGDQRVIDFVQTAVGYSLTGHINEQCLFLMIGSGSNGKSTFLDILHKVIGKGYAYPAPFSTFERSHQPNQNSNDIATLAGRRLVTASEASEGTIINDARIKSLTGGESISARFLHQEFFEFKPTFKIWLGVNHLPRVLDDSDGFWRRMRLINFPVKFFAREDVTNENQKVKDIDLPSKLELELPGILAWAVEGAVEWYKHGLKAPQRVTAAVQTYRTDSDPLHEFLTTHCEEAPGELVLADTLFKAYIEHCKQRMLKPYEILSSTRFQQKMSRVYPRGTDDHGPKTYMNIRLKETSRSLLSTEGVTIKYRSSGSNVVQ